MNDIDAGELGPLMEDTDKMPLEFRTGRRRHAIFDPTINLGHILTALSMLAVGFGAYNNLDKRLAVQEQLATQLQITRTEKDQAFKETLHEVKQDVKEMRHSVDELARALNERKK